MKKVRKTHIKSMPKKEYNKIIDEKNEIIENYYDNKIDEINEMSCAVFIVKFLNKKKQG